MTKAQARKRLMEAQNKINRAYLFSDLDHTSMDDLKSIRRMLLKAFNKLK